MKSTILFFLLSTCTPLLAQDYIGVDFLFFEPQRTVWDSGFTSSDSVLWENGSVKYSRVFENNRHYNYHYDERGNQIMKYEVTTQYVVDTTFTMGPKKGDVNMLVTTAYVDVPNGQFERVVRPYEHWAIEECDLVKGTYVHGVRHGTWSLTKKREQLLLTVELDTLGRPEGIYKEVYLRSGKTKWLGQYAIVEFTQLYIDYDTGEEVGILAEGAAKIGTWKRYSDWDDCRQTDEIEFKHYPTGYGLTPESEK